MLKRLKLSSLIATSTIVAVIAGGCSYGPAKIEQQSWSTTLKQPCQDPAADNPFLSDFPRGIPWDPRNHRPIRYFL